MNKWPTTRREDGVRVLDLIIPQDGGENIGAEYSTAEASEGCIWVADFKSACFTLIRGVGEGLCCRPGFSEVDADSLNCEPSSNREAFSSGNRCRSAATVIRGTERKAEVTSQFALTRKCAPAKGIT